MKSHAIVNPETRQWAHRPQPSGYLVVAVCNFDDIPVALYADQGTAIAYAKRVRVPRRNPLESWDITHFIGVKVLSFKDGRPQRLVFHEERS